MAPAVIPRLSASHVFLRAPRLPERRSCCLKEVAQQPRFFEVDVAQGGVLGNPRICFSRVHGCSLVRTAPQSKACEYERDGLVPRSSSRGAPEGSSACASWVVDLETCLKCPFDNNAMCLLA
eukprot:1099077-Pelagomonas_calceolata.AAC.2